MIKNPIKTILVAFTILFITACSESSVPEQGKQYSMLPNDLSELNLDPVTEIFSLTCGHCRNMEQMIPDIEKAINQEIGKVHVTFNQSSQVSALFYYAAEMQLNKAPDSQMLEELFAAVQMQDGTLTDQKEAITKAFTSRNLKSPYKMEQSELDELSKYVELASQITEQGEINSVPTFIVKGKYQIITEGHQSLEEMAETINYLLSQK